MTTTRIIDISDLDFATMPSDAGQIVTVSYAVADGMLVCCTYDASDRTTTYEAAEIDENSETEFQPWNGQLPDCGEYETVLAAGSQLAEMVEMLAVHGDTFTGNCAADIAQDWIDNGFDADDADGWCKIGCWEPAVAAQLRDAGLTPADADAAADKLLDAEDDKWNAIDEAGYADDELPCQRDSKYTDGSPIYSVCNHDTSIEEIIAAAR